MFNKIYLLESLFKLQQEKHLNLIYIVIESKD